MIVQDNNLAAVPARVPPLTGLLSRGGHPSLREDCLNESREVASGSRYGGIVRFATRPCLQRWLRLDGSPLFGVSAFGLNNRPLGRVGGTPV
jgi:hypothetical protein